MSRPCRLLLTILVIAHLSHSAWSQIATAPVGGTLSDPNGTAAPHSGQRLIAPMDTSPRRRFQLDDLWSLSHLSDVQVAPDGHSVMVVVTRANPAENRYDRTLVTIDVANGEARTVSERRDISSPRWSPHGDRVAFLAHDDTSGHTQAFILPTRGEARRVTSFPQGVERLAFSPDGDSLAVIAADVPATREGLDRFNDASEVGHDDYLTTRPPDPLHLWLVPL